MQNPFPIALNKHNDTITRVSNGKLLTISEVEVLVRALLLYTEILLQKKNDGLITHKDWEEAVVWIIELQLKLLAPHGPPTVLPPLPFRYATYLSRIAKRFLKIVRTRQ